MGNRLDIHRRHHLRFGADSRQSADRRWQRIGLVYMRSIYTNLYSCKIKSHRRAAATRLPVALICIKNRYCSGPGPISRSATLADAARNPVDYLLIKCLRFIGSRPDLDVARGSCNRPNLHRARETSPSSPPPPPDTAVLLPAPINREGMARRVTRLTQLFSVARAREGIFAHARACVAIKIATQENEFSRSAKLINAYLDAAF